MKFCEKLIILRKRRGMTQEEFARAVGVSRQSVYKWESGRSYPEAAKLMEIRRLYGISVDELLDESEALLLSEEKRSERPVFEVPPAPAPIYRAQEKEEKGYRPIPAEPTPTPAPAPAPSVEQEKKEAPATSASASIGQRPAQRPPRMGVAEPPKKKKQNPLLELVGSLFGRKR